MIFENIILKITKSLVFSQFEKLINSLTKDVDKDSDLLNKIKDIQKSNEEIKTLIPELCRKHPWHHLCKEYNTTK